ncbi:MAG: HEAT repeat domain-containing protein, partial [Candidatus Eisenbacteria bacterium]|nr:HEAT repeat domain-containing protein [Candidatus Eisenbacteria bacterium]
ERGLYFWGPTPDEPRATWQMWSHGQEQEARHWIPCHDAPHEKMTTELLVTVPEAYTVVSNGALLEVGTRGKSRRWHFRESVPYSSYLITLVVGVFTKLEDECDGLPVEYYVEPGREEDGWRSFGRTPDMIRTFAAMLECPFPYEKYAQVAVRHFMFGGMENTSATTQTDGTLHDERAAPDFTSDDLVAHELAHQWFGDLLTCQHWAHAWLNEGFATYFEAVWKEADQGADEFELGLVVDADAYLSESYRRAIVSYRFAYPFQLFDQHLYPKAAWVVHMLRRAVGDEAFWKAVRLYVRRHAARSVETIDLRRAFEEATGRNLEGFFDQWLFHPGHPELEIDCRWDESARALQVAVKQVQKGADAVVYRLPIEVAVVVEAGTAAVRKAGARRSARGASPASRAGRRPAASGDVRTVARMFELEHREQTFVLELPSRPVSVVIDPQARVLKTCKLEMPIEWVEGALVGAHRSTHVYARVELVRQIARKAAPRAVEILAKALRSDPCWGVQAEAATALGKVRTPAALAALLSELPKHPKARRAWVQALGEFRDAAAVDALTKIIRRGDPSYLVEREALVSLGRTRAADAIPRLEKALSASVKRRDWRDILMSGAVAGLAAARSESIEPILAVALDRSRYWATRVTALGALATIGSARPSLAPRIAEGMSPLFEDPEHLVMYRLPDAYASLGHQGAIP